MRMRKSSSISRNRRASICARRSRPASVSRWRRCNHGDSHAGSFAGSVKNRREPGVRHVLVAEQRRAGQQGGVVMEGRDIGSVVFPDAQSENFPYRLARNARRAALARAPTKRRRYRSAENAGGNSRARPARPERSTSPLVALADAVVVDSTAMEPEEVARLVVMLASGNATAHTAK